MQKIPSILLVTVMIAGGTGCQKKVDTEIRTVTVQIPAEPPAAKTDTLETRRLGSELDKYIAAPSTAQAAEVDAALADLDGEIAELKKRAAETTGQDQAEALAKFGNLSAYREQEMVRYNAAKLTSGAVVSPVATPADSRTGAEKIGSTLDKVGDTLKKGVENVGDKIKEAGEPTPVGNHH